MKNIKTFIYIFIISLICFSSISFGKILIIDPCVLTLDLKKVLESKYSKYLIVNINYLNEYDKNLYQKEHKNECPGLIKLNFFGDNSLTYAVLLFNNDKAKPMVNLIVATKKKNKDWKIIKIDETDAFIVPVIFSAPPGEYIDLYQEKKIKAKYDTIVFIGYESWAIMYSWQDGKIEKIWLND